jgi:hypothetical protein
MTTLDDVKVVQTQVERLRSLGVPEHALEPIEHWIEANKPVPLYVAEYRVVLYDNGQRSEWAGSNVERTPVGLGQWLRRHLAGSLPLGVTAKVMGPGAGPDDRGNCW